MPTRYATGSPPGFDVEACFRHCLSKRRRKRSTADRDRRIRSATREVEFELGEWERHTGRHAEPERSRLRRLAQAEGGRMRAEFLSALLRIAGIQRLR